MGLIKTGEFIETVDGGGMQISLLASGDGTEVIYHKLSAGIKWTLTPEADWNALEYIYVISGNLLLVSDKNSISITKGNSFSESPVRKYYIFLAEEETEFLYVSSQPVFHHYSQVTRDLKELAISIEEKDGYTVDHCKRIKHYSMLVGETLQLNSHQMIKLNLSSFFHDVGKLRVPLEILQKPGVLTEEEWNVMKKHTTFGKYILEEIKIPLLSEVAVIVEQHHERFDGKGYPNRLKGDEITIEAAIISVVDSFDAMTSNRVYKRAKTAEEAFKDILNNRGTMYHPKVVDAFMQLKEKILNY